MLKSRLTCARSSQCYATIKRSHQQEITLICANCACFMRTRGQSGYKRIIDASAVELRIKFSLICDDWLDCCKKQWLFWKQKKLSS